MASSPASAPVLVLASTFYTPALEKPFAEALACRRLNRQVLCVPYNQLQPFLLNPSAFISSEVSCQIILLLRVEDLIRPELSKPGGDTPAELGKVLLTRANQVESLLGRTQLRLTVLICPSGCGHYDLRMVGNQVRVAEHKIASALRLRQRHMVVDWFEWADFDQGVRSGTWLNLAGDRLGHVPFTPSALNRTASYFVERIDTLPITSAAAQSGASHSAALERFLGSLKVEFTAVPLALADEQAIIDLVRHTTHFVNLVDRQWDRATLRQLIGSGEAWSVRVRDRFGDYGLAGAVTFNLEAGAMKVGMLFLTCPVLGKQVEHAFFGWLGQIAAERRAEFIEVPFTRGRDNEGLCSLLSALGEHPVHLAPSGAEKTFRLRVAGLSERATSKAVNSAAVSEILSAMSAGSAA